MKKYNFVYLTLNKRNGKCYIGSHSTNNLNDGYIGSGLILKESIRKYKKPSFFSFILKQCVSIKEARNLEEYYISIFDTLNPNGYNISPTGGMGENSFGLHSEETKKKLSEIRMGVEPWNKGKTGLYKHSEETKKKLSELNKGDKNANYGNSALKGIKKTEEHKKKISKSKMGKLNPNAGIYEIFTPDNKFFKYVSATDFVKNHPEYNINRHFIYSASKSNRIYKDWIIKKIN